MERHEWDKIVRSLTEETAVDRGKLEAEYNAQACDRATLEARHGQVWDQEQVENDFEIEAYACPLVCCRRKCDGVRGTMCFQSCPRFYWGWEPA